jgi:O-antigen/teichoic acid export membrane protein
MPCTIGERAQPNTLLPEVAPAAGERAEEFAPTPGPSLRQKVIAGAFWTTLCAAANKVVTFLGQIALAWFLVPEDFGLVALALALAAISSLLTSGGLRTILIQRGKEFDRYAGQVFWLSLGLHLLAGAVVLLLALTADRVFGNPRIAPLVALVGLTLPLGALSTVHAAKLSADLRFQTVTLIQLGEGVIQTVSAILLALASFGPFALVLPQLWVRLYVAAVARWTAGPIPLGRPHPAVWVSLIVPALWLMLLSLLQALQTQGPIFIIGLWQTPRVAGLYSWGYQLSAQAVFLLAVQLQQVLFPSLTRLNAEPERQFRAFRRIIRTLNTVVFPVCAVQVIFAGPVIERVFGLRWQEATPVVQMLSIGMIGVALQVLAVSLLMAQGRYATLTLGFAGYVGLVAAASWGGSLLGQAPTIALFNAGAMLLGSGLLLSLACHSVDQSLGAVLGEMARPAALTAVVTLLVAWPALGFQASSWAYVLVGLTVFGLLYAAGVRFLLRSEFDLMSGLVRRALDKNKPELVN